MLNESNTHILFCICNFGLPCTYRFLFKNSYATSHKYIYENSFKNIYLKLRLKKRN